MSYQEELKQPEWQTKREEILLRDASKCQKCSKDRPRIRGLLKDFGVNSIDQLREKDYSLFGPAVGEQNNYENLGFIKGIFLNMAKYIGDRSIPFNLSNLVFALQRQEPLHPFQVKYKYELVAFYKSALDEQDHVDFNIHHRFYIKGKKPWEYESDALITLCASCHTKVHKEVDIPVYDEYGARVGTAEVCGKCSGSGYLAEYSYFQGGVCFKCMGEGALI
jgi:5-methylcytosine-specific restriction endonuclease McrA